MDSQNLLGASDGNSGFGSEAEQPQVEAKEEMAGYDDRDLSCAAQVLRAIGDGYVTYASLVGRLTFTRARLAYLLRRLGQSGLIVRHRLWGDRRRVEIELTPRGRDHLARIVSEGASAALVRCAPTPRRGAVGVVPCDVRGLDPGMGADVVAVFCDLIRHQLGALPPGERIGVGAAVVMALSSLGHSTARGATRLADLDSFVGDIRATALAISSGNASPPRRGNKATQPAGSYSQP